MIKKLVAWAVWCNYRSEVFDISDTKEEARKHNAANCACESYEPTKRKHWHSVVRLTGELRRRT